MIAISIANSVGSRRSSAPVVVVPVATAATGVGETSFTANWNAFAGANYYLLDVSLNSSFSSFVGSYQNYVTIGTSQLVSGLTPNTTYYYRLRAVTGVDSDAAAFFSRVYTAGGVLSYTEVTATETLVYDMKTAGVWSAMKAVYPMVGASAAACAQNLKSSSFTGSFSSGWTFASDGATPNGTSAYFNTNCNINGFSSLHYSFYSRTTNTSGREMGVEPANAWDLIISLGGTLYGRFGSSNVVVANGDSKGFYINTEATALSHKVFKNSSQLGTTQAFAGSYPSLNVFIGAINQGGTPAYFSAKQTAFNSIGDGLTDTQASNFYTAVQTFNQTLNRQVGAQIVSDADAQAYIDRVYTAGGTLTNTEANAVNQLVIDMKGAGIWTAMKAVYPMVGASAAACAQNLVSSSFTGTFSSGFTFASTGVTGNGSSTYMNTFLNPSSVLSNSANFFAYVNNNGTNLTNRRDFNITDNLSFENGLTIDFGSLTYSLHGTYFSPQQYITTPFNSSNLGFFQANYLSGTNYIIRNNAISNSATQGQTYYNFPLYLGAAHNTTNGTPLTPTDRRYALAGVSDGLTTTQASDFYTAVQAFQTTLSRQV